MVQYHISIKEWEPLRELVSYGKTINNTKRILRNQVIKESLL